MVTNVNTVLSEANAALKNTYGNRLNKVILFGSYARGEQKPDSDIDLLVVLNDATLAAGKEIRLINQSLFSLGLKHGTIISAHPVSNDRFENEVSFFFNRIKKEGKQI
ncbi:MAG: hypothetical protein POELPBGB_01727 [Bacteroidia bacterium]|nr:hypothetical protein [Bacteroidia bacterium]